MRREAFQAARNRRCLTRHTNIHRTASPSGSAGKRRERRLPDGAPIHSCNEMAYPLRRQKRGREVECLACGKRRFVRSLSSDKLGECPDCGYVGWAFPADVDEKERPMLHLHLSVENSRTEQASRSTTNERTGPHQT